jgi:hypothetical protein
LPNCPEVKWETKALEEQKHHLFLGSQTPKSTTNCLDFEVRKAATRKACFNKDKTANIDFE